jgi:hypothetical protein
LHPVAQAQLGLHERLDQPPGDRRSLIGLVVIDVVLWS